MIKRWKAFFHLRASSPVSSHGYRWSICNWFYHGTITCWTNQVSRPRFLPACRRAAVLVDLAACPGEVRGILTPRTIALPGYSGQIAIPGGKIEARDKSPAATALCEAQEDKQLDGKTRHFHAMPYGALNILSVTAGILRNLYERLYS